MHLHQCILQLPARLLLKLLGAHTGGCCPPLQVYGLYSDEVQRFKVNQPLTVRYMRYMRL
jgi:hypothetical protein